MKQLFITKHEVKSVEDSLGFTYTFNPYTGRVATFSSLFYFHKYGDHSQIPLEVVHEQSVLALTYCLVFVVDCDKEELRKLYTDALAFELTSKKPETSSTFQAALNILKISSENKGEEVKRRMKFIQDELKRLDDDYRDKIQKYNNEVNYLYKTINSDWFVQNSLTLRDYTGEESGIYKEYPERYFNLLHVELPKLNEIVSMNSWVIPLLEADFNPYDSFPNSEGNRYLSDLILEYLKSHRTEEVELFMQDLENKKFIQTQLYDKVDYLKKFRLLKTCKIGNKLLVKRTSKSLKIYVVPDNFKETEKIDKSNPNIVEVFGKIGNSPILYGWLHKGGWIGEVEDYVKKLEEKEVKRLEAQVKIESDVKLSKVRSKLNVLSSY